MNTIMKKKLLITLGCSYTEGVGCYEPTLLNEFGNPIKANDIVYTQSINRFHRMGWPIHLQKKIQYDYLWNLGYGGASNSTTVKRWFEVFSDVNLSEQYDVLVLWMVTFAGRISFYKNGIVKTILPNSKNIGSAEELYKSYINFLDKDFKKDIMLETYFYVNIIKNICDLANYKFLYINVNSSDGIKLDSLMKGSNSLNFLYKTLYPTHDKILDVSNGNKAFCGHPNEKGYEIIADTLFNLISISHSHLINKQIPLEYKNEYLGNPKQW
jgi:hypothetical protein